MARTPKNKPQGYNEMLEAQAQRSENKFYKALSDEHRKTQITEIVTATRKRLEEYPETAKIELTATSMRAVVDRTTLYLQSCEAVGVLPSYASFCHSLGYTVRGVERFIQSHQTPISQYIEVVKEAFAESIDTAALGNHINAIPGIFLLKSLYGRRETSEFIVGPPNNALEPQRDMNDAGKYLERLAESLPPDE